MVTAVTRTNLDLMRSIAVGTVLIDHTAQNMKHPIVFGWNLGWLGVFGVYLFFVHTCLVLMWSLERRPHTLDFYTRRVFRIYPLAMFFVLIVTIFHLKEFTGPLTVKTLLANLLLVTNLVNRPLVWGVLWSLPLEVQMYLLLPMLFLFARRERVLWPFLLLWAFACKLLLELFGPAPAYNFSLTTIPLFLPGVMAYIGYKRRQARVPAAFFPLLLLALCAFYEGAPSVPRGWVACLLLGLLLPFFKEVQNKTLVTISHTVAKYSYGIYLLHPFALLFAFKWLKGHSLWVKLPVEALSIAIMAFLAYHLVEHPLVKIGSRIANRVQDRFGTNYTADYGLDLA